MPGKKPANMFLRMPREEAVRKWAGWWWNYVSTEHFGSVHNACKTLLGMNSKTGKPVAAAQGSKWQFVDKNSLPSQELMEAILKSSGWTAEEILNSNYEPKQSRTAGNRYTSKDKANMQKANEAVFKVTDEDIPKPDMSFSSSEEFDGMYDFELSATLPMAGVLAVMALLDDAFE